MSITQIIFWSSSFYALYIVVLYPLLLNVLARYRPAPVHRQPYTPTVSIVLATHNGAAFLKDKLDSIFNLDYPVDRLQLVIVDDGSTDATRETIDAYGRGLNVFHAEKGGKAVALNRGISAATGEILVLTDVRQRLAPDSLRLLMENFADPTVGGVSAELQIQSGNSTLPGSAAEGHIGSYWRYERWIRLNLSAVDSIFGASGSYYAIRRDLAVTIPANTLLDDVYLPLHAFFKGFRLLVDSRAKMFDYPTSLSTEFGRKVRTLAGNYQILKAYPQLLGPHNRLWFHFVSYKFGRLLLPFALLTAAISSLLAGGTLAALSAAVQLGIYVAAIVDPRIPEGTLIRRATSLIKTFVVMMLATMCAVSIWFVPPERLWRHTRVTRRDAPV
jgi:poly-beta-1,6-N-acetyl-D-glucosamine synthase